MSPVHPQDRTIAVWDMKSPNDIVLRRVLVGHRAAVNVVDFDDRYIVSASGDRTIKVCDPIGRPSSLLRDTLVPLCFILSTSNVLLFVLGLADSNE